MFDALDKAALATIVSKLTDDVECQEAYAIFKRRWLDIHTARDIKAVAQFNIGDMVQFERNRFPFGTVKGKVTKLNAKSVIVIEDRDDDDLGKGGLPVRWTVSPSLLTKVKEK